MQWLRLFSKMAFIGNLFFLVCLCLQFKNFISNHTVLSTVITIGYILSPFVLSPVVVAGYGIRLLRQQPLNTLVPRWLVWSNFIFFVLQIIFVIIYLHDTSYY